MKKYIQYIKETSLFARLTESEILSSLDIFKPKLREYKKGNFVLQAGDYTDEIGLLLSGSFLIIQEDIWGHRNIMNRLPAGNTFAEPFSTSNMPLNIKKIISAASLNSDVHNKIFENLVSILAHKTLNLNEKISYMNKRTTRDKLLSYLSSQSQKQKSLEFDIAFNRQELADYLCVERSAMTVELSKLQKEGILTTNRNHFILHIVNE